MDNNTNTQKRGGSLMGIIVCQDCNSTVDYFEDEKVTVLYQKCGCCDHKQNQNNQ